MRAFRKKSGWKFRILLENKNDSEIGFDTRSDFDKHYEMLKQLFLVHISLHTSYLSSFEAQDWKIQRKKITFVGKSKIIETTFSWRLECLYEQLPPSIWNATSVDCFKAQLSTAL